MNIVRFLIVLTIGAVIVGCHSTPPPPQTTVVCKRDGYGTVVCNRSVSN